MKVCKTGAITKEDKFGAVLVDQSKCNGCRACFNACPYGSPQFASDNKDEKMSKCTMCVDRLNEGQLPVCVRSCSMRALAFGPLDELKEKYGDLQQVKGMPSPDKTKPAVVFKDYAKKQQVVKYDAEKALKLWQTRSPYAEDQLIFDDPKDVTEADYDIVGRHRLELKAKTAKEKQYFATDDD